MIVTPETASKKVCPVLLAALMLAGKDEEMSYKALCMGPSCMNWEWVSDEEDILEWKEWDFVKKHEPKVYGDTPDIEARRLWNEYQKKANLFIKKWRPQTPKGKGWELKEVRICDKTGAPVAVWARPVFSRKGTCAAQNLQWIVDPPK